MGLPILSITARTEQDIVLSRQHARQIAALLNTETQDQIRFATAVSEIVRNAVTHGGGGKIEFVLEDGAPPQVLLARIVDHGTGIKDLNGLLSGQLANGQPGTTKGLGLINARRLVDQFKIESEPGKGTTVEIRQRLPKSAPIITADQLTEIVTKLNQRGQQDPYAEVQRQNKDLMGTLDELQRRQEELTRLNRELEDTNRGVVALYSELDDKADRLRQADEMKSRFLSYMSHEFRTPLNSILALTRLLIDRSDGELTEEQEKQVSFIARSAGELTELVNDLLDLAKIEAGKVDVHPSEFSVSTLFSALRGLLRPLMVTGKVNLIFEEPNGLPLLYTDEGKIAQILRNFLSNAIKFTEQGEVRLSAKLTSDGQAVDFSVSDTGVGIANEDRERIFQEFAQVQNSVQKRVKGTGLGLPLSRKLAELLGGTVEVKSELGVGSTFSAIIPLAYPLARPPKAVRKVLIIDDEDAPRYVLKRLLTEHYSEVLESTDGLLGLSLAREKQPQVIFLDLMMPKISGTEVLAQLKADPLTEQIPVIIVTSKAMDRRERNHLARHAMTILSKAELSQKTLLPVLEKIWAQTRKRTGDLGDSIN